jgi:hypothetical protein
MAYVMAARARRARKGQEKNLRTHALKTYDDGMSTGKALCGASPESGWTEVTNDVDCPRCLAKIP